MQCIVYYKKERIVEMELFDRYVHQVGRRLPQRMRADVEQELRSLLTDALEERAGHPTDGEAMFSEEGQIAVLEEFGPPEQMAAKYRPQPRYVIGPKVFDLYLIVIFAITVAGLVAALVVAAVSILGAGSDGVGALELLAQTWTIFMNIALSGIGSATLVFALLERVLPDEGITLEEKGAWNPRDLPQIEIRDEIKRAGLVIEIAFLALLLIVFTVFPNRIVAGAYYDGAWRWGPPLFSVAFFSTYLPLLGIRWGLTIVLDLVLLRQGRWQLGTRIADICFHGLDIFILSRLLAGPSVLNAEAFRVILDHAPEASETLLRLTDSGIRIGLLVALIVTIVEILASIYRLIRDHQSSVASPLNV
jgi:hypothetical protein